MDNSTLKENLVAFKSRQGQELQGGLLRLSRHAAAFELYGVDVVLHSSQTLQEFRVYSHNRVVYSGRAVVRELINAGAVTVCEVNLDDVSYDAAFFSSVICTEHLRDHFHDFVVGWQKNWQVRPDFKVALADIQTFLVDLRRWVEQIELGMRSLPPAERAQQESETIDRLGPQIISAINELFFKFEEIAKSLDLESQPSHRSYAQRLLHPIVLCAPFAFRAYQKPLGYAGDYEMVNMMLRDPKEGESLFAKIFNVWLLQQHSAAAHRNRIEFLRERLVQESLRCLRLGRSMRVLNLGCGPAVEVQKFMAEGNLADYAQLRLWDFNDETVNYTTKILGDLRHRLGRATEIIIEKKSVHSVLKEGNKPMANCAERGYDFAYCSGLFDYLSDRTCTQLMNIFWNWTRPGGLVLATNVTPESPNRGSLELVLDWHLNYRRTDQFAKVAPEEAPVGETRIWGDETGVNIFLEARKPDA